MSQATSCDIQRLVRLAHRCSPYNRTDRTDQLNEAGSWALAASCLACLNDRPQRASSPAPQSMRQAAEQPPVFPRTLRKSLTRMIHEHFCCNRRSAALGREASVVRKWSF